MIVASAMWLAEQGQRYADNRVLDAIIIDDHRRAALAREEAGQIVDNTRRAALAREEAWQLAQLDTNFAKYIAEGEAWLAAHPER